MIAFVVLFLAGLVLAEILWIVLSRAAWPIAKAYLYPVGIYLLCRVFVWGYKLHCWAAVKLKASPAKPIISPL